MVEFENLIREIQEVVYGRKNEEFTKDGAKKYIEYCNSYFVILYRESYKICKFNRADVISGSHVSDAFKNLTKNSRVSRVSKLSGILGGIFLGTSVSNLFAGPILNQAFSSTGMATNNIVGILGASLIIFHITKE